MGDASSVRKKEVQVEKSVIGFTPQSIVFAILFAVAGGIGIYFLATYYNMTTVNSVIIILAGIFVYTISPFLVFSRKKVQETQEFEYEPETVYVDKPYEVVKTIEKPVYIDRPIREVVRTVDPTIVRSNPIIIGGDEPRKKKLNIPHYAFVCSRETKTYHKRSCRLGKLIKKKFKVSSNSEEYFKKMHYHHCKVCIKNKK